MDPLWRFRNSQVKTATLLLRSFATCATSGNSQTWQSFKVCYCNQTVINLSVDLREVNREIVNSRKTRQWPGSFRKSLRSSSLLKKVSGTLRTSKKRSIPRGWQSSRHLFQQAAKQEFKRTGVAAFARTRAVLLVARTSCPKHHANQPERASVRFLRQWC